MNVYKKIHVLYLPGNKEQNKLEWSFPYVEDEYRLMEDFHSLDLSALDENEKTRISKLILEIPRYGVVRTDSADPVLGLVIVALKRK